jgi:hypothetical protein
MSALRRTGVALSLLLAGLAYAAPALAQEGQEERAFGAGRRVWMDLSAGGYRIQAGRDDRIVVRWQTDSHSDAREVRVDIDARGSNATIVTRGPRNHFKVVIELPARTDLTVRLTAGDLRIREITGSKDISSWAGDIDIEVGRPEEYRSVEAAVTAGDLSAPAFRVSKGGLFRSFSWRGNGRYDLTVRLTAGDLRLRQ